MRLVLKPKMMILTFLPLFLGLAAMVQCQTIYVNHTNNKCDTADGSKERPYRTVAEGAGKAATSPPGSKPKLEIQSGVYNENPAFPNNMTLTSSGGAARIGFNSTRKICQFTGEDDRERCGWKSASQTVTNYQLAAADLGIPVEYKGRIYFIFGDTFSANPEESKLGSFYNPSVPRSRDSDSVAWVKADDNPEQCLKLRFIKEGEAPGNEEAPGKYRSPRVKKTDTSTYLSLGTMEVPTGAFTVKDSLGREKMYVFFTNVHHAGQFDMGRSYLARLEDINENLFTFVSWISCRPDVCGSGNVGKFINISPVVVNNADIPGLPQTTGQGVLLWSSGQFRKSDPYLAYFPLDSYGNPGELRYWGINKNTGQPDWVNNEADAIELFNQPCTPNPGAPFNEFCGIGELSVTWNPFLRKWLMLYNHGTPEGINYRVADKPWGPWESRGLLFDMRSDGGLCHFMHQPGCDSVYDGPDERKNERGLAYGPYVIPRYTRADATTTTIYWVMSTHNPYNTVLMKSILRLSDARRAD